MKMSRRGQAVAERRTDLPTYSTFDAKAGFEKEEGGCI